MSRQRDIGDFKGRSAWFALLLLAVACGGPASKRDRRLSEIPPGGFSVRVVLSARARSAVREVHASVMVKAYFDGEPRNSAVGVNEEGLVDLGDAQARLDASDTAQFQAIRLTDSQTGRLAGSDYRVLVNVFSVGPGQLNLLACGGVQDRISAIRDKLWTINCGSIGEPGYPR
jgi:hypothetical protein